MSSSEIENLIQRAERGELEIEEYQSIVDSLDLKEEEEAFLKMTGTSLILENRGEEAVRLSEELLETKYNTDDLIDRTIEEIEGMSEVYKKHMSKAKESLAYSEELIAEITENIEEASSNNIYIDIDIHEESSFWPDLNIFGRREADTSYEEEETLEDDKKRDTLRWLAGAGLTGLGVGGAAVAYDEVTGDPQALNPEDYDSYIDSEETLEDLAMSYQNSDTESLNSIGDRLEQEIDQDSEINLGFKSGFADDFVDVNAGRDLVKRYELGQAAYEQAIDESLDVTRQ